MRNTFLFTSVLASFIAVVGGLACSRASAQATCTNPPVTQGYASPCPVFSLSASTVSQAGVLTFIATPQPGYDFIYTTAYIYANGTWQPYTLDGSSIYPNYSSTQATLTLSSTQLHSLTLGTNYAAVWDWLWDATANNGQGCYKGPGLNQCNTGQWRLRTFSVTVAPTPTPTFTPTPTPTPSPSTGPTPTPTPTPVRTPTPTPTRTPTPTPTPSTGAIIADHNAALAFASIPRQWLDAARQGFQMYYGHTSHGQQITSGLQDLENQLGSAYGVNIQQWSMPNDDGTLLIYDNSTYDWSIDFLPTVSGVLSANPQINIVMYMWCGQHTGTNWQTVLNTYLSGMQALEAGHPGVKFIYATGNAMETDCSGCTRQQFNEQLRQFARTHNKILFDFGDLDAWYGSTQSTYSVPNWCGQYGCASGQVLPVAAPEWGGSDYNGPCGHVLYPSCDNKAKAFWWLLARLAGWNGN